MKEHVKIQINSLEALERLIGGDSQLEMEIRDSVVQDFTRKHLKAIAEDKITAIAAKVAHDTIGKAVGTWDWNKKFELNPNTKKSIADLTLGLVSDYVKTTVATQLREKLSANLKLLEETLERQTEIIATSLTDANIDYRLNAMVDREIKRRLGLK